MNLLFITTNNLSTNPRLKKEIEYAISRKFSIILLAFKLNNWSDQFDQYTLSDKRVHAIYLSASRRPFLPWFSATLVHYLCKFLWPLFRNHNKVLAFAHHKRSFQLIQILRKIKHPVDLVISHNLGALYPAWWYSRSRGIPFNFDVEDYYPGERIDTKDSREISVRKILMRRMMPAASFITYAAPLIGEKILNEFGLETKRLILVNNSFPKAEFKSKFNIGESSRIKLVWFSQKIGFHRGLESVIRELSRRREKFSMTLIGWMDPVFYREYIESNQEFISCLDPLPQKELHRRLGEFDVGLAVENPSADINRDICLTNKIWAYYLSGLYIIATNTRAQCIFMERRKDHGRIISENKYYETFIFIQTHIDKIRTNKQHRQQIAIKESFDTEQIKLQNTWKIK